MSWLILALLVGAHTNSFALADVPNQPPNPCYSGCTKKMHNIYSDFLEHPNPPALAPKVYSGNCYFKSKDFNPDHAHRALILLDQHPLEDRFYFATGFTFFGSPTKYADWDLAYTRERTHGAWNRYNPIEVNGGTARVVTFGRGGQPAWIYYMRQDPVTQKIFYITYWGSGAQISFCELNPNH